MNYTYNPNKMNGKILNQMFFSQEAQVFTLEFGYFDEDDG